MSCSNHNLLQLFALLYAAINTPSDQIEILDNSVGVDV